MKFRTYRTPHFDIHAHQGEERLAARLGAIAERVRSRFEPTLGVARGRVQVILVDQSDLPNGWATPFPYDTIEITAAPPAAEELIGNTTDWLEVVFTHEYTHILHLDRSRGFMGGVRRIFGRAPLVFPNAYLPIWQIEGLATYEESRATGEGRVPAGDFRAIVATAARQRRFAPLDRASGGVDDWPAGNTPYVYGAYFHQYLSDRFGAARVEALADATAGRLPLFGAPAFRRVYGESLGTLWRDFRQSSETEQPRPSESDAVARRLTRHGFVVAAPAVGSDGVIYYRTTNADGFPALMRLDGGTPRRIAWRAQGERTSARDGWVVFDQVERVRSTALYSDLYAVRQTGGPIVRLTTEARAAHPDLSPDGRRIACVVQKTGYRALALLDFRPGEPASLREIVDDPESDFAGPRWSPDGRRLVAERRRPGAYELVLVDAATGAVQTLLARSDARLVTPSWRDGGSVLFAADPGDAPFNVFVIDVASGAVRQITDSGSGAQFPEIGADGSLVYVGYSADGYDLFSLPPEFRLSASSDLKEFRLKAETTVGLLDSSRLHAGDARRVDRPLSDDEGSSGRPYSPRRTLVPTYWEPVVESDAGETLAGAATAMTDALGRHSYAASAAWTTARPRPDWTVSYAYDRWRPTLLGSYADDTDPIRGGELQRREAFAGMLLPFRRIRWSQTVLAGFDAETDTLRCGGACRATAARDRRSLRGGWRLDSRRVFPYSISSEEGVAIEAALDTSRTAFGSDANAQAFVFDARAFQRVLGRHAVLAVRFAAATGWGDARGRRIFSASGPGPSEPAFDFGRDTIGLLRGFDREDVLGTHAAVLNVDLRVPLRRVQRGAGTWPLFVRSLHGAAFVDAGSAWDDAFRAAGVRRAIGGELSADVVVFYYVRTTIAAGAAWTHDPVARRDRGAPFVRIGYAF